MFAAVDSKADATASGRIYAVCTEHGAETRKTESLFGELSPDGRR